MTEPEIARDHRIPIIAEEVRVGKTEVTTDQVRVTTSVKQREMVVEEDVERGALHIERVAVDREVETAPAPRQEGDTTIISLIEERVVVTTRLFVVEEIHIRREALQERVAIPVTLRSTHATIERPLADTTPERDIDGRSE